MLPWCNEHGTIYAISSDFGDRMTTQSMWLNMIVKMTILSLLGSNDDKEKIGVARPEGPPLRSNGQELKDREEIQVKEIKTEILQ